MADITFSPRQWEVVTLAEQPHRRLVVPGPTQSGKSFAAFFAFFRFAALMFSGYDFGMASKSQYQLTAVALKYMIEFGVIHGSQPRRRETYYEMDSWAGGAPNRFHPRLGNNEGAAERQIGPAMAGFIFDEWPKMPRTFLAACESRCSVPGAKLIYTGNPENPYHFGKTDYVDACETDPEFGRHIPFDVWDNPEQTQEYVDSLDRTYPVGTAMNRRMKHGEWAASEGMIWEFFENAVTAPPPIEQAQRFEIAADHASSGVCHALLLAQFAEGWWAVDEWRHDGNTAGKLEVDVQARRMLDHFNIRPGGRSIARAIVDPAASSFRAMIRLELRRRFGSEGRVIEADNDVTPGLQLTEQWMRDGVVHISPKCRALIAEMHGYVWDEKAMLRGVEQPLKQFDHGCDCLRYWCYTKAGLYMRRSNRPWVAA